MPRHYPTTTYTLDLGAGGEHDVLIEYDYSPGFAGTMYLSNGDPGDPPEPAEVIVMQATLDGRDITWLVQDYLEESDNFMEHVADIYNEPPEYEDD